MKTARYILYPFAFLYGTVATFRNFLFSVRILRSQKFPIWIISVGNLSTGGSGKSPHVEYIARLLENLNKNYENLGLTFDKMAILSRGYKRATRGFLLVNNSSNAREVGDEPLQLKRQLKDMYVAVDAGRVRGISLLLGLNPQLRMVIMDDAFQHRYVKPTLSVLVTNYNSPFYNDNILPVGSLREPRGGYKRAEFIIVTNTPLNITDGEKKVILKNINPTPNQQVFFSSIIYKPLMPVYKSDFPVPIIDKKFSVLLLTGIANTHSIYNHLAETARDVIHIPFPDHHLFQPSDIAKVSKSFNSITNPDKIIVTTEKDSVRLQLGELAKDFGTAPVYYLPINVKVHEEKDFENALIGKLNPFEPTKPIRKLGVK